MSPQKPLFSVVIPTRNRAHLLDNALRSALGQTFIDYEIIVSDNCSEDTTPSVVDHVGCAKVRYARPNKVLPMPEHWEFALSHARGEYVTYLCDDDAWCPQVLQRVSSIIEREDSKLVVVGTAVYYAGDWLDEASRNCMVIPAFSGKTIECNSRETLSSLFMCRDTFRAPRMINSFCNSSLIAKAKKECGDIFFMCPDYSFPAVVLPLIKRWTHIDMPLRLQGVFPEGIGSTAYFNRGKPSQQFLQEFGTRELLEHVPLQAPVVANYIAETLLIAKERLSRLDDYDIDWVQYFVGCWEQVLIHERAGVTVDEDKAEFWRVFESQPRKVRSKVLSSISSEHKNILVEKFRGWIVSLLSAFVLRTIHRATEQKTLIARGEDVGFDNILECSKHLATFDCNSSTPGEL